MIKSIKSKTTIRKAERDKTNMCEVVKQLHSYMCHMLGLVYAR